MQQQRESPPETSLDFDGLTDVLCAVAIRAGVMLELDKIAELKPADRAMHAAVVVNKIATADPQVGRILSNTHAVPIMRAEILRRRSQS
jgi:hypothetical protein